MLTPLIYAPSRGITPIELSVSQLWHCGPGLNFVSQGSNLTEMEMPASCLTEMKAQDKKVHTLLSRSPTSSLENIIHCKSYSSFSRLLSITGYVIKFVQALKRAIKGRHSQDEISSSEDLAGCEHLQQIIKAENMWIQEAQRSLTED